MEERGRFRLNERFVSSLVDGEFVSRGEPACCSYVGQINRLDIRGREEISMASHRRKQDIYWCLFGLQRVTA